MNENSIIYKATVRGEAETVEVARKLSSYLQAQDIVTLNGTLGAGKTAFARALIRALCGAEIEVPSPTFNLLLTYECDLAPIYHYDFYRLEDPEEVWELDIEDAFHEGITLIEWVQHLQGLAPEDVLAITLKIPDEGDEGIRDIEFSGGAEWQKRLKNLTV